MGSIKALFLVHASVATPPHTRCCHHTHLIHSITHSLAYSHTAHYPLPSPSSTHSLAHSLAVRCAAMLRRSCSRAGQWRQSRPALTPSLAHSLTPPHTHSHSHTHSHTRSVVSLTTSYVTSLRHSQHRPLPHSHTHSHTHSLTRPATTSLPPGGPSSSSLDSSLAYLLKCCSVTPSLTHSPTDSPAHSSTHSLTHSLDGNTARVHMLAQLLTDKLPPLLARIGSERVTLQSMQVQKLACLARWWVLLLRHSCVSDGVSECASVRVTLQQVQQCFSGLEGLNSDSTHTRCLLTALTTLLEHAPVDTPRVTASLVSSIVPCHPTTTRCVMQ
jgi:hypothetical protein